jgi:GNAT superfamily N-acetyltransferase
MAAARAAYRLEPLGKAHDRESFRCGVEALDQYLRRQAGQDRRRDVAAVFVLVEAETDLIAGYFTLSSFSVELEDLPEALAAKLPRYGCVPAALIGRLAVDLRFRGRGVGKRLLVAACRRVLVAAETLAAWAVVVDAKNDDAKAFYEEFGFSPMPEHPDRLFITLADLRKSLGE